jgi:hypothetical protein
MYLLCTNLGISHVLNHKLNLYWSSSRCKPPFEYWLILWQTVWVSHLQQVCSSDFTELLWRWGEVGAVLPKVFSTEVALSPCSLSVHHSFKTASLPPSFIQHMVVGGWTQSKPVLSPPLLLRDAGQCGKARPGSRAGLTYSCLLLGDWVGEEGREVLSMRWDDRRKETLSWSLR